MDIEHSLGSLDMELTERCNNRCIHCYINQPENDQLAQKAEISSEAIKTVLAQAAGMKCRQVKFTGGEPLLRKDFEEIYLFARELGMNVKILTNARLVSNQLVDCFKKALQNDPIEISVYGTTAQSYNRAVASHNAFDSFITGINLLRENEIPFILKNCLLFQNDEGTIAYENFCRSFGVNPQKGNYASNLVLRGRLDDEAKNKQIINLRWSPELVLSQSIYDKEEYIRDQKEFLSSRLKLFGSKLFFCGAGKGAYIDAYGNAQMCVYLRHPKTVYPLINKEEGQFCVSHMGQLNDAISNFFPTIRDWRSRNPEYLNRCGVCFIRGFCEQCPGKSWMEHGVLDKPVEYICQVTHMQAVFFGLLMPGERAWNLPHKVWQKRVDEFLRPTCC